MNALNDQLKTLRLSHAVKALEQQQEQLNTYAELDFEERLSLLQESETLNRNQTKIQRLKRQAKLRVDAQPSQLIYKEGRNLNRKQMSELLTGCYLHKHQNILITGPNRCWQNVSWLRTGNQCLRPTTHGQILPINSPA